MQREKFKSPFQVHGPAILAGLAGCEESSSLDTRLPCSGGGLLPMKTSYIGVDIEGESRRFMVPKQQHGSICEMKKRYPDRPDVVVALIQSRGGFGYEDRKVTASS